jgi:hypothetical protein
MVAITTTQFGDSSTKPLTIHKGMSMLRKIVGKFEFQIVFMCSEIFSLFFSHFKALNSILVHCMSKTRQKPGFDLFYSSALFSRNFCNRRKGVH